MEFLESHLNYLIHNITECKGAFNLPLIDSKLSNLTKTKVRDGQSGVWKLIRQYWREVLIENRDLYQKLVDYFFMDFVCFGYSLDFDDWVRKKTFPN